MALQIKLKTDNGVILSYHHIAAINIELNQRVTVIVESYIDEEGRQYDKDYMHGLIVDDPVFPYTNAQYISIEWNELNDMLVGDIIQNAYNWLKQQPQFIGAIDV